ncbi:hypothetical protein BRC83_04040 [Halobacteriales archaeon QS_1_68_17]|nr:MAG: hypothetical protein BRC83_04040 [Halobacteriales archaeon QS_1_68_17]
MVADLHARLERTAELPVDRDASRWLGEAEAVAADVAAGDAPPAAVEKRVGQVRHLLANVDGTGSDEADAHVDAAVALLDRIEARLDDCSDEG